MLVMPVVASAQLTRPSNDGNLVRWSLGVTIRNVVEFILTILASLAVLMIVVSGIMYITAGGDQGRIDTAKSLLTNSVIGLVVSLVAWVIVYSVSRALGAG